MSDFILRDANLDDRNFIFTTWLKGLYFGSDEFKDIPWEIYYLNYRAKIHNVIIPRDSVQIKVSCLQDATNVIVGYAVYEDDYFHWLFVKPSFRSMGIGRSLVPHGKTFKYYSQKTNVSKTIARKYNVIYNPFLSEGDKYA